MFLIELNFLLLIFITVDAWEQFESPIEFWKPNANGVYEIKLDFHYAFTMYSYTNGVPVVYDISKRKWAKMDSDERTPPCNNVTYVENNDKKSTIDDVNQYTGLHVRTISVNGPGNTLVVPLGAEVLLIVKNSLFSESITIHVHGVDKKGLWYTDGTMYVQQCPIPPGSEYDYRFIADTPGTHFYHGHLSIDRGGGVVGGFVVKKLEETTPLIDESRIKVERDYYVLIQDIGHLNIEDQWLAARAGLDKYSQRLNDPWRSGKNETCWSHSRIYDGTPVTFLGPLSALLIGNKGWYDQEDIKTRPSSLPLSTYFIRTGEYIKMRFVNAGVGHIVIVWLEDHKLTVVATDGQEIKPIQADAIAILPAERYDVLIKGKKQITKKIYRLIVESFDARNFLSQPTQVTVGLANLLYEGHSHLKDSDKVDFSHQSCTRESRCLILNCPLGKFAQIFNYTCLNVGELSNGRPIEDKSVIEQRVFESGYEEYFLNVDHHDGINGNLFQMPMEMPYFQTETKRTTRSASPICENGETRPCLGYTSYNFTLNNIVQLTLYMSRDAGLKTSGSSHPFHLHGTHFYVMKIVYPHDYTKDGLLNSYNNDIPCNSSAKTCYALPWGVSSWMKGNVPGMNKNPILKDTVIVPIGGYVVIRFRATNPGWWFAHCHFLYHHVKGMAFAIRIGEHDEIPKPPENFPHSCGKYSAPPLSKFK